LWRNIAMVESVGEQTSEADSKVATRWAHDLPPHPKPMPKSILSTILGPKSLEVLCDAVDMPNES
jgi:hypothetical protein